MNDQKLCPHCQYEKLWPGETWCYGCRAGFLEDERRGLRPLAGMPHCKLTDTLKELINKALDAKEGLWKAKS